MRNVRVSIASFLFIVLPTTSFCPLPLVSRARYHDLMTRSAIFAFLISLLAGGMVSWLIFGEGLVEPFSGSPAPASSIQTPSVSSPPPAPSASSSSASSSQASSYQTSVARDSSSALLPAPISSSSSASSLSQAPASSSASSLASKPSKNSIAKPASSRLPSITGCYPASESTAIRTTDSGGYPLFISPSCVVPCQTHFTMALLYVYEASSHFPENLERLKRAILIFEKALNKAGRGKLTFDLSYPIAEFEIKSEERDKYIYTNVSSTTAPLQDMEILKTFYKTHPDNFDFVTIIPGFKVSELGAGSYFEVQNTILGGGSSARDSTELFGSQGRLLGTITLDELPDIYRPYELERLARGETTEEQIACKQANTLAHEVAHQWGAYIGDWEDKGTAMPLRQGGDWYSSLHFSYGLNIGYDPLGGGRWGDNGDGTYTLLEPEEWCAKPASVGSAFPPSLSFRKMSDLTFYLAGAIDASEVKPMVWMDTWEPGVVSTGRTFDIGETIVRPKTIKTITIDDIIKRYGERVCLKKDRLHR